MRFALAALAFGLVVMLICSVGKILDPPSYKIQTYNGTTWVDAECFVDKTGVLWCGPRG